MFGSGWFDSLCFVDVAGSLGVPSLAIFNNFSLAFMRDGHGAVRFYGELNCKELDCKELNSSAGCGTNRCLSMALYIPWHHPTSNHVSS